jgi:Bacterial SH3 domain
MPQSVVIGLLVLGGVLLLIAITGGKFKIFVAEVDSPVSSTPVRLLAGLLGLAFIAGALLLNRAGVPPDDNPHAGNSGGSSTPASSSGPAGGSGAPAVGQQASKPDSGQGAPPGAQQGSNAAISSYEYAIVFDPPTNIRLGPATSSNVLCSVTAKTTIRILSTEGNWYRTDVCGNGQTGYIYRNQVKF